MKKILWTGAVAAGLLLGGPVWAEASAPKPPAGEAPAKGKDKPQPAPSKPDSKPDKPVHPPAT